MLVNLISFLLCATAYGQHVSTIPTLIPLIHKAPHVNAWISTGGNLSTLVGHWPQFYTMNSKELRWMIAARVDGTAYTLQGAHANYTASNPVAVFITPTRTIFTMDAGPVRLNLTYLTPIELDDWTLHSLPFGYIYIDLWSTDGNAHSVQLYSDTSGDFVSRYPMDTLYWNTMTSSTLIYHQARLFSWPELNQTDIDETSLTRDGTLFFAFRTTPNVAATWQSCYSETCRNSFFEDGKLGNISDSNFRGINNSLPVMAFALDVGNITQSDSPLAFTIGLFFNTTIWYDTNNNETGTRGVEHKSLWQRRWSNIWDAIDSCLFDFPHTLSRAAALDAKITTDIPVLASKLGLPTSVIANLTDLVIMSVRQTIGSLEITTNRTGQGPVKLDDIRVFMKDVGYSRRVNPVEVLYASFPAFLYLNTTLAGKLLEPLFETNTTTRRYTPEYAKLDLGDRWPYSRVNDDVDNPIGIEASGSMLILALAYTQKSGDSGLISRYYKLLLKWAEFLVKNSLNLNGFITADGSYSAMSNLALKGITGIHAMGKINQLLEGSVSGADTNRTSYYLEMAQNYAQQWQNLSLSSTKTHIVSEFGNDNTWGLLYNLYAVRLIGADLIPNKTYELQASYLFTPPRITDPRVDCPMVRYESEDIDSKTHWALLAAGSILQDTTGTRDRIIGNVHHFSFVSPARYFANPSMCYRANTANVRYNGTASAANGAAFVFHALSLPDLVTKSGPSATPQPSGPKGSRFGYKSGITLAVLVVIIILVGIFFFYWRRFGKLRRITRSIDSPSGDTDRVPYLDVPTAPHQPSKHRVSESVAQQPNISLATNNDRLNGHAKPSTLRRDEPRTNNPEMEVNSESVTQEDNLRRQVEQLRIELNEALRVQEDGVPPPYTDDV